MEIEEMKADLLRLKGDLDYLEARESKWEEDVSEEIEAIDRAVREMQLNILRVQGLMPWPITENTETTPCLLYTSPSPRD